MQNLSLDAEEEKILSNPNFVQLNWSQRWKSILSRLQEIPTADIQCYKRFDKGTQDLLSTLTPLVFSNLFQLSLNKMELVSIERIHFLKAPQLKVLNLGNNHITNLRSIRKLQCPNLTTLNIYGNPFVDINPLPQLHSASTCEVNVTQKRYKPMHVRREPIKLQFYDLTPLLKLESNFKVVFKHIKEEKKIFELIEQKQKNANQ